MDLNVPFFNLGGAAFSGIKCIKVSGSTKYAANGGGWLQSYTIAFQVKASEYLAGLLKTPAGWLKNAPLDDFECLAGFYPAVGDTHTEKATVSIQVSEGEVTMVNIVVKIARPLCRRAEDYTFSLATFAPWLEQVGALILRPRFKAQTGDIFEDEYAVRPLTIHSPWEAPRTTYQTGDLLLAELGIVNECGEQMDIENFVGSAEEDI